MMTRLHLAGGRSLAWAVLSTVLCVARLGAASVTYLMSNQSASSGLWELVVSNSALSTDSSTTVLVSSVPANNYLLYVPGQNISADVSSLPSAFTGKGWRIQAPVTGIVPAGSWTLHFKLYNPTGLLLSGSFWARLWEGSAADGSDASAVTAWTSSGSVSLLSLLTLGSQVTFNVPSNAGGLNRYFFVEMAWQVGGLNLGGGLNVALVCDEASGEDLVLPSFATFTPTFTPSPTITPTRTPTPNNTATVAALSFTPTQSFTLTPTPSPSATPALTQTAIAAATQTALAQQTADAAATLTAQPQATQTAIAAATQTAVAQLTANAAATLTAQAGGGEEAPVGGLRTSRNAFDPRHGPMQIWGRLAEAGRVDLELYDVAGRRLGSLLAADLPAGRWDAAWDGRDEHGRDLGSDLYLLVLRQPGVTRVFKTALLRD